MDAAPQSDPTSNDVTGQIETSLADTEDLTNKLIRADGGIEELLGMVASSPGCKIREVSGVGYLVDFFSRHELPITGLHVQVHGSGNQGARCPGRLVEAGIVLAALQKCHRLAGIACSPSRLILEIHSDLEKNPAYDFIAAGALEHVHRIFSINYNPGILPSQIGVRSGVLYPASEDFTLVMERRPGNPPIAAPNIAQITAHAVTSLSQITWRQADPLQPTLIECHSIHAEAHKINQSGSARLCGTLQALDNQRLDDTFALMDQTVSGIAKAFDISCKLQTQHRVQAVVANRACIATIRTAAEQAVGKDAVIDLEFLTNDFATLAGFLKTVPGAAICFGACKQEQLSDFPAMSTLVHTGLQCLLYLLVSTSTKA